MEGSQTSDISQMVNAMNAAITAKATGIAVCLVSLTAFNGPTNRALDRGIPVLSYNADAPNNRLAYVGQDLYLSGYNMGQRIVDLVGSGDVALFIATPGQLNIQPRIDGAIAAIKKFGKGKIKTTYHGHRPAPPRRVGRRSTRTTSVTRTSRGCSRSTTARRRASAGSCRSTASRKRVSRPEATTWGRPFSRRSKRATWISLIDQQPDLQGVRVPVLQLFFYKYSSGSFAPSHTNTGISVRDEGQREAVPDDEGCATSVAPPSGDKYPVTQPG